MKFPFATRPFASGFGSVRRFNETFQALFDRAPGALRRASGPEVPAGPRGEINLLLRYHSPRGVGGIIIEGYDRSRATARIKSCNCWS